MALLVHGYVKAEMAVSMVDKMPIDPAAKRPAASSSQTLGGHCSDASRRKGIAVPIARSVRGAPAIGQTATASYAI